jgi:hypothetical protein
VRFLRLDEWITANGPHYMVGAAHSCRAKLRAARGDDAGAWSDVESALDFGRRSGEPQALFPPLADAALVAALRVGSDAEGYVAERFDELVAAIGAGTPGTGSWTAAIALALAWTDQSGRLAAVSLDGPSRWAAAAGRVAAGRHGEAADGFADMGALPEEALARVLSARDLIKHGRGADADAELRRALEFWRGVGAAGHEATAEAMLAKTA